MGIRRDQDTLLDIGCGPLARAEIQFSLRGFRIGLDVSTTTLKKAKEGVRKYVHRTWVRLVRNLPLTKWSVRP